MRNLFLHIAILALVFASCTKEEPFIEVLNSSITLGSGLYSDDNSGVISLLTELDCEIEFKIEWNGEPEWFSFHSSIDPMTGIRDYNFSVKADNLDDSERIAYIKLFINGILREQLTIKQKPFEYYEWEKRLLLAMDIISKDTNGEAVIKCDVLNDFLNKDYDRLSDTRLGAFIYKNTAIPIELSWTKVSNPPNQVIDCVLIFTDNDNPHKIPGTYCRGTIYTGYNFEKFVDTSETHSEGEYDLDIVISHKEYNLTNIK